jgi:hypothetical protein
MLRVSLVLVLPALCAGKLVTFSNVKPRLDSKGAIINAHDGTTQRFGSQTGPFYYHAMGACLACMHAWWPRSA